MIHSMDSTPKTPVVRHTVLVIISFASYWLWTFAVLITKAVPQRPATSVFEDSWFWSTFGHLTALLLIIALARFYAPFSSRRPIRIGSPSVCLLGYGLLLYSGSIDSGSLPCLLLGAVLTGVGNAGLLICWCESFTAGYHKESSRLAIAAGILLSIAVFALLAILPQPIVETLLTLPPFITMATASWSLRNIDNSHALSDSGENQSYSPYFAVFCLVYALPLGFFQMYFGTESSNPIEWTHVLAPSFILIVLLMAADVLLFKKLSAAFLAKTIVPIGIAGLLLLGFFDGEGAYLGGVLIYSSQQCIAIFFYGLFASMSARGRALSSRTFATGVVFIDGGYAAGQLAAEVSEKLFGGFALELSLGVMYVAVLVGVFAFPRISEAFSDDRCSPSQSQPTEQNKSTLPSESTVADNKDKLGIIVKKHQLTAREEDMLHYLLRGKSVAAIARETFLSQNTVKTHVSHIYQKLDVHSRDELISYVELILGKE